MAGRDVDCLYFHRQICDRIYSRSSLRSGLIHKSRDDAMKLVAFVSPDMSIAVVLIIIRYQFPKILTRFRMRVVVEF